MALLQYPFTICKLVGGGGLCFLSLFPLGPVWIHGIEIHFNNHNLGTNKLI